MADYAKKVRTNTLLWDLGFSLSMMALLMFFCVHFSAHRILWSDELFGWMLIADPSFRHMLAAWQAGADGGGVVFYLIGRLWFAIFGHSELALRLLSAFSAASGAIFVWLAARRSYPHLLLASVILLVWCGTLPTLDHVIEARFYGLLLGTTALSFLVAVRAWSTNDHSVRYGALLFLTFGIMAGIHPFGIVFGVALLSGMLLLDVNERSFHGWCYTGASLGLLAMLAVSRQAMRSTAAVGQPHFWTWRPNVPDLLRLYRLDSRVIGYLIPLTGLIYVVVLATRWSHKQMSDKDSRPALLFGSFTFASVPLAVFIYSHHAPSLFVVRYLLPFDIPLVIVLTEVWSGAASLPIWRPYWRRLVPTGMLALAIITVCSVWKGYSSEIELPPLNVVTPVLAKVPPGVPIVVERVDWADLMWRYAPTEMHRVFYLLDWDVAMDPESPRGDVSGYHEMQNWKKLGFFAQQIVPSEEFLDHVNRFVVLRSPQQRWFIDRILAHPDEWTEQQIGSYSQGHNREGDVLWSATVWLVTKKGSVQQVPAQD